MRISYAWNVEHFIINTASIFASESFSKLQMLLWWGEAKRFLHPNQIIRLVIGIHLRTRYGQS